LDVFVGYVLLDVWIANQDRHHENWGAIRADPEDARRSLTPTFDHGAGLARNLEDSERAMRLATRDRNASIHAFVARGQSRIYKSADASKPLLLLEAFQEFAERNPGAASIWLNQLRAVSTSDVSGILDNVPSERMSEVCRRFTLELLERNRLRLLEIGTCA
jgi:hypothetical protein